MTARPAVLIVILLAVSAMAGGCAQCQQDPDSLAAAALDERMFARIASVLGEQSPATVAQAGRPRAPRELDLAVPYRAPHTVGRPAKSPVQQAAAAEPLEAAAPMPPAESIETAPSQPDVSADLDETASNDPTPQMHTGACDDACCVPGTACPLDRPCPFLGSCGDCPACLVGHRCCRLFTRPEPGPPPIRYRPAMPPKFLPVPTQPVLSPARPEAPDLWRGDVEFSWRPEITFPGND